MRVIAATIGAYAVAVVWLTWPLAAHLSTHLPAPGGIVAGDTLLGAWTLAWQTHALVTDPSRIFDANVYYPASHALLYGTIAPAMLPFFAPTFLASGNTALALNLMLLTGITLTAASVHVVVTRWTRSQAAGAVAAVTLLSSRWILWTWIPNAPVYCMLAYFPLIAWLVARPRLEIRHVLAIAALAALQGLSDPVYVAPAVFVPLGVLSIVRLARPSRRREGLRLAVALLLAGLALAPMYGLMLSVYLANPGLSDQTEYTARVTTVLTPTSLLGPSMPTSVPFLSVLLCLAGALWRFTGGRRDTPLAAAWTVSLVFVACGVYMSLGPAVVVAGHRIPLPHAFVVPEATLAVLRVPRRLGVAALMGVAMGAGLGFAELTRRLGARRTLPALLAALAIVAMRTSDQYGTEPGGRPPLPATYPLMPADDGSSPLIGIIRARAAPTVEVPLLGGRGTWPAPHVRAMYRSTYHWAPLLNGYHSYWPAGFPERMALVMRLPDEDAAAALWRETGLALVLAHTNPFAADPWRTLYDRGGSAWLRPVARDRNDVLFAVAPPTSPAGAPR